MSDQPNNETSPPSVPAWVDGEKYIYDYWMARGYDLNNLTLWQYFKITFEID